MKMLSWPCSGSPLPLLHVPLCCPVGLRGRGLFLPAAEWLTCSLSANLDSVFKKPDTMTPWLVTRLFLQACVLLSLLASLLLDYLAIISWLVLLDFLRSSLYQFFDHLLLHRSSPLCLTLESEVFLEPGLPSVILIVVQEASALRTSSKTRLKLWVDSCKLLLLLLSFILIKLHLSFLKFYWWKYT